MKLVHHANSGLVLEISIQGTFIPTLYPSGSAQISIGRYPNSWSFLILSELTRSAPIVEEITNSYSAITSSKERLKKVSFMYSIRYSSINA